MVLGEMNGRAFGINKYLSVMDTELAIESGEILLKNRKMTRDEAIAKLKESKELLDLGIIESAEYEKLKEELTPIIINK
jgi:chaperonin cofactor prefoldin